MGAAHVRPPPIDRIVDLAHEIFVMLARKPGYELGGAALA